MCWGRDSVVEEPNTEQRFQRPPHCLVDRRGSCQRLLHCICQAIEQDVGHLKERLRTKARSEALLVQELEGAKHEFSEIAPHDSVEGLQNQMKRAEAARAEYAGVLLKILRKDGVEVAQAQATGYQGSGRGADGVGGD